MPDVAGPTLGPCLDAARLQKEAPSRNAKRPEVDRQRPVHVRQSDARQEPIDGVTSFLH